MISPRGLGPFRPPFEPTSGCRHRPLTASVTLPRLPKYTQRPPVGLKPRQVQQELHDPNRTYMFQALVQPALAVTEPEDELDQVLLQGWRLSQQLAPPPTAPRQSLDLQAQHHTVRGDILLMWQQRASLRALAGTGQVEQGGRSLKTLWDAWAVTAKLQATTRQLRRECRRRKTLRILEAVNSENIHQAAKKFGPKQVRRRLQLRSTEGQIQSQEAELQQILKYFRTLFAGPIHTPVTLSQDMEFAEEELQQALGRLAAGKAMPTPSAPAALWKLVAQRLRRLFYDNSITTCGQAPPHYR